IVGGLALSGISITVVTPPAAALMLPVSKPSQCVRPGSLKWTCGSMHPGRTNRFLASITSPASGRSAGSASPTTRPPAIATVAGNTPVSVATRPPAIAVSVFTARVFHAPRPIPLRSGPADQSAGILCAALSHFSKIGLDVALMASKGVGWMAREQHRKEERSTGGAGGAQGQEPATTPTTTPPSGPPAPQPSGSHSRNAKLTSDLAMLKHFLDGVGPDRTPEEREYLQDMARMKGRSLTPQEEVLYIAQARMIGDL